VAESTSAPSVSSDRTLASLLAAAVEASLDAQVILRPVLGLGDDVVDFEYVAANSRALAWFGAPSEVILGARMLQLFPGQRDSGLFDRYREVLRTGRPLVLDGVRVLSEAAGQARWFDFRGVSVGDCVAVSWRDMTERVEAAERLAQSEEHFRLLAENSSDVVLRTRGLRILWVSPSLTRTLGWTADEWVGRSLLEFLHADDTAAMATSAGHGTWHARFVLRCRLCDADGTHHWADFSGSPFVAADGRTDGGVSSFRVVDDTVRAEVELIRRATHDDLTDSLKRDVALQRLTHVANNPRAPGDETGVLFIDLDDLKVVNDAWGHPGGDRLLRETATRVRSCIRAGDLLARVGGDEFLVVLESLHSLDEATDIAAKVATACGQEVATADGPILGSVSIGATLASRGEDPEHVIARADAAMYLAKQAGGGQVISVLPGPSPET